MSKFLTSTLSLFLCLALYGQESTVQIALDYLDAHKGEFHLNAMDIQDPVVTNHYTSQHNGVTHVYFNQQYQGIKIYNAISNVNIAKNGKVLNLGNRFEGNIANKINATQPSLSALEALEQAVRQLDLSHTEDLQIEKEAEGKSQKTVIAKGDLSLEPIPAELIYYTVDDNSIRLAWNILIHALDRQDIWSVRIDAENGTLLNTYNRVLKCNFGHPEHANGNCAHNHSVSNAATKSAVMAPNQYFVLPLPVESPNHGDFEIVDSPWEEAGEDASPFGWHSIGFTDYTITRGNNVYAQEDRNGNNGTGYSPESEELDFVFPVDLTLAPAVNTDAAVTNLFYWCNLMHDVWYHYGFDELSGNFQQNNNGVGGLGGDYIVADAQDGSGVNNANFSISEEGQIPRIQMFEWLSNNSDPPAVNAGDLGSFDAGGGGFGPTIDEIPAIGKLVWVNDGSPTPTLGCFNLSNEDEVAGNIALIDRGECFFVEKVLIAQDAGAVAAVIINHTPGEGTISMGAPDDYTGGIEIPSLFLSYEDGEILRDAISEGQEINVEFEPGAPNIDGDFDNGVIAHEYGHGISSRLTGGSFSAECLTGEEQMGEGWSDFFGLMMTMTEDHTRDTPRGYGTYAFDQPITGSGIREAPYTTNFSVNNYTYGDSNNGNLTVPHGVGFVWATIIWEVTWDLVDEYGFDRDFYNGTGGNNMAMQLVIDGLKLQECNPGFVDGRDAILLADQINYGGANQCLLWEAFARRGLGYSASQGSPNLRSDQVQAFDLPPSCSEVRLELTADQDSLEQIDTVGYTLVVTNKKGEAVSGASISTSLPDHVSYVEGSSDCSVEVDGNTLILTLDELAEDEVLECHFQLATDFPNFTKNIFVDNHEDGDENWNTDNGTGSFDWSVVDDAHSGENAWFAQNPQFPTDQYLEMKESVLLEGENLVMRFWHKYNTEQTWDGGVIEYSNNGGFGWDYINNNRLSEHTYDESIEPGSSDISGRIAFTGISNGYVSTTVDLNDLAGEEVQMRFRMASDGGVRVEGWYVDDVQILDAVFLDLEACMEVDGQDDICHLHKSLVTGMEEPMDTIPEEPMCVANPGVVTSSEELEDGTLTMFVGEDVSIEFTPGYDEDENLDPGEDYEHAFVVSDANDGFAIVEVAFDGQVDFEDYAAGEYVIWAVSYATFNEVASLEQFLDDNGISSIPQISTTAIDEGACLDLTKKDQDGNDVKIFVEENTGINDLTVNYEIELAPVPVVDWLTVSFVTPQNDDFVAKVFDIKGRLVSEQNIQAVPGQNQFKLQTNEYASGTYLLQLSTATQQQSVKFVKE